MESDGQPPKIKRKNEIDAKVKMVEEQEKSAMGLEAAGGGKEGFSSLPDALKPFYIRASRAEERLAKLEAALKTSTGKAPIEQKDLIDSLQVLQEKMEAAKAEQEAEREEARKQQEKLEVENAKLQYRITHLVRALEEADGKLANVCNS